MEELLTKLYYKLSEAFQEKLRPKEIYYFNDGNSIDVFKTLMFLKKNKNDLNKIMLLGSISKDELEHYFGKNIFDNCLDHNYIIKGNALSSEKIFIGANGLFKLYSLKEYDIQECFEFYQRSPCGHRR